MQFAYTHTKPVCGCKIAFATVSYMHIFTLLSNFCSFFCGVYFYEQTRVKERLCVRCVEWIAASLSENEVNIFSFWLCFSKFVLVLAILRARYSARNTKKITKKQRIVISEGKNSKVWPKSKNMLKKCSLISSMEPNFTRHRRQRFPVQWLQMQVHRKLPAHFNTFIYQAIRHVFGCFLFATRCAC